MAHLDQQVFGKLDEALYQKGDGPLARRIFSGIQADKCLQEQYLEAVQQKHTVGEGLILETKDKESDGLFRTDVLWSRFNQSPIPIYELTGIPVDCKE